MFKCYRQLEHSDCGLTCIRMIARHHGVKVPLRHLRAITDLSRLGMSIKDITECFRQIEMESLAVKVGVDRLQDVPLPAILYWQQKHFVVLYKIDRRRKLYYIADPGEGKLKYSEQDFVRFWIPEGSDRGLTILADPTEAFGTEKYHNTDKARDFIKYLVQFVKSYKKSFITTVLITVIVMLSDLVVPLLLRRTIDEGIGLKDLNLVWLLLLGQFAVMLGGFVASNGMSIILTRVGLGMNMEMVRHFLHRLAVFPLSFFDRKVSSDFLQKINDQSRIKGFLLSFPQLVLSTALSFIVFSVLLFHYSPLMFSFFIAVSLLEIGWSLLFVRKRKTLDYINFTNSSENRNHAYELTNGMADLKVNNAQDARIAKWEKTQMLLNKASMKSAWLDISQKGGQSVISRMKELAVTGIGAAMVINGDISIGVLMTLSYITGRLSQPFNTISSTISSTQDAIMAYQRIEEVICGTPEQSGDIKFSVGSISLKNVWFKYAGASSPYVLRDLSIEIENGKTTALVGESGCGKSTLIKLMLGFYIPARGKIILGNNDINEVDIDDWLRHCGAVMQDGKVFSGSILENIALSDEVPDTSKACEVLQTVGLMDFVNKLPMGINTNIGVAGITMSGGQNQRLLIARALYKDPDILFMDEATSSLDANNERNIIDNIIESKSGKTLVIAAHRLSTVRNADKIVYLKDGRIEEVGSHEELCDLKGEYWKLVRNQLQLTV